MAKRRADTELNHDNWDAIDKPQEKGTFGRASDEELKSRVIKMARRRNPISSVRNSEDGGKSEVFSGFSGFTKPLTPTSNAFSFLSNLNSPPSTQSKINGFTDSAPKSSTISTASALVDSQNDTNKKTQSYYSKLKGLNESVSKWIKQHVDVNPLINLQPIFKDYEKYFTEIEKEKDTGETKAVEKEKKQEATVSSMSNFVFKAAENVPDSTTEKTHQDVSSVKEKVPTFSFGISTAATSQTNKPTFSFGSNTSVGSNNKFSFGTTANTTTTGALTFSFGSTASTVSNFSSFGSSTLPTSVTNLAPKPVPSETENKADEGDEESVPEEPQLSKVVEKDSLYTTVCKVFIKKGAKYEVCGVGDLYIKPIKDNEKVQVIVRADNNLGKLLCNFVLSKSIPTKRLGAKDIMLVCLITPDVNPPPVPIIFRVKTSEEADKLLEVLEKHKK